MLTDNLKMVEALTDPSQPALTSVQSMSRLEEYRKIVTLPPAKLGRSDIERLGDLLIAGLPIASLNGIDAFGFSLTSADKIYRATSITHLLARNLPSRVDDLSFDVQGWTNDGKIDKGVSLYAGRIRAACQIHSIDEVWFKGKTLQIEQFFAQRSPWYGKIRSFLPAFFGVIGCIAIGAMGLFLHSRQFYFAFSAAFYVLVFSVSLLRL